MYHPSRGGVRGGTDQFSWDAIKTDKHRENYLGHSVMAPVGRWQKGKDLSWYAKERKNEDVVEKAKKAELAAIKKAEEDAMLVALGFKPAERTGHTLGKEEIEEILKPSSQSRGIADVDRVQGVGAGSGRAAMLVSDGKQSRSKKGIVFESHSQTESKENPISTKEAVADVKSETRLKASKINKKEKKHKKKKKKQHKRHNLDSDSCEERDVSSSSKVKASKSHTAHSSSRSGKKPKKRDGKMSDCSSSESYSKQSRSVHHHEKHSSHFKDQEKRPDHVSKKKLRYDATSDSDSYGSDRSVQKRKRIKKEIAKHASHKSTSGEDKRKVKRCDSLDSDAGSSRSHRQKGDSKDNFKDKYRTSRSHSSNLKRRHDTSESD